MDVQELRAMKLHDRVNIGDFLIVRVPGGWLYVFTPSLHHGLPGSSAKPPMCFVQEYWFNSRAVS